MSATHIDFKLANNQLPLRHSICRHSALNRRLGRHIRKGQYLLVTTYRMALRGTLARFYVKVGQNFDPSSACGMEHQEKWTRRQVFYVSSTRDLRNSWDEHGICHSN